MNEHYLSDDGVINVNDIEYGKLNIIDAPCGCGKTSFVENKLWNESWCGDLLYLIDTKNGLEAFKLRGEPKEYNDEIYYKHNGITAMTYACFAMLCIYNPDEWLWNDEGALIVCDELQSIIKWAKIPNKNVNLSEVALNEIHKRIANGARVVAISATTNKIKEAFADEYVDMPIHGELRRYKISHTKYYQNIFNLVDTLPQGKKGLIYVPHVMLMIDIYNVLAERDISAATIWSMANEHKMSEEDLQVRQSILAHDKIPDDIQVLLINAASETGINIKSDIDYVVINTTEADAITQVIGRVRHDIDTVYLLTKDSNNIEINLDDKWLNKPLYKEDKDELCIEIGLRENGRLLKWTSVKKYLIHAGYQIQDKKSNSTRFTIIS